MEVSEAWLRPKWLVFNGVYDLGELVSECLDLLCEFCKVFTVLLCQPLCLLLLCLMLVVHYCADDGFG